MTMQSTEIDALIERAWRRRDPLRAVLDVYRLVNGAGDGLDNLSVDRYGDYLWIEYPPHQAESIPSLVRAIDRHHRFEHIYARDRRIHAEPDAVRGEPPEGRVVVREGPFQMALDFGRAGNPGLYLDARPARQWLLESSRGRRVLNLFAFSGSLGIAAALGGARSVTHVDNHAGALAWCRHNSELNGIATDDRDYARLNIYQHLRRAQAARQKYDGIVVDAPPGPPIAAPKDRTPGKRGPDYLLGLCARMLAPAGWVLCFYHRDPRRIESIIDAGLSATDVALEVAWTGQSGDDFPVAPGNHPLRLVAYRRS